MTNEQRRGYLFEVIVRRILQANGWQLMPVHGDDASRYTGSHDIILKGRGTWHQIDSPCVFSRLIPFTYPLRMIAEVKFRGKPIEKRFIREFIGTFKDISENYFVSDRTSAGNQHRYSDMGVYFSASGFNKEASSLAYAHGIYCVSFLGNPKYLEIKKLVQRLAATGFPSRRQLDMHYGVQGVMSLLSAELSDRRFSTKVFGMKINDEQAKWLSALHKTLSLVDNTVIGMTPSGMMFPIVGDSAFPDRLFTSTDVQKISVHYQPRGDRIGRMWIEFSEDSDRQRYYFDAPPSLARAAISETDMLERKKQILGRISVSRRMGQGEILRTLELQIDEEWLGKERDEARKWLGIFKKQARG